MSVIQLYVRESGNGRPINRVRLRFINYYDVYSLGNTVDPKTESTLYWPRPSRISFHRKTARRNGRIELENYLGITKKTTFLANMPTLLFSLRKFFLIRNKFTREFFRGFLSPSPRVLEAAYTVLNPCMMLNSYMRSNG